MTEPDAPVVVEEFLETQEYRRFAEFCDACRRYRYIGLCHGPPGVGKTLSARHYARWAFVAPTIATQSRIADLLPPSEIVDCHTLLYTPTVTVTPRRLELELHTLQYQLKWAVVEAMTPETAAQPANLNDLPDRAELVIVDEADRLKFPVLEQLRDTYDRGQFGLVLISMPGLEKRLARYAQFYSRMGFVHHFRTLSADAMRVILAYKWQQLGLTLVPDDLNDAEAIAAIIRVTGGNFRLVHRLFSQIERIMLINGLRTITPEVIEAARQSLVIGPG
jgi:DNA transposition AAA+ family ATPase